MSGQSDLVAQLNALRAQLSATVAQLAKVHDEVEAKIERRETFSIAWSITPVFIPKVTG